MERKAYFLGSLGKKEKVAFIAIQNISGRKPEQEGRICPEGTWWPRDSRSSSFQVSTIEKGIFFLGCLLIDPSFDDQILISVVVKKRGRQTCLRLLMNKSGKCQSPSGRTESDSLFCGLSGIFYTSTVSHA